MAEIKRETAASEIDRKNLDAASDISALARQELEGFDHESFGAGATYTRMQQEIINENIAAQQDKPLYELEVTEPDIMPVIHERAQQAPVKTARLTLNLRGKLIIGVTASILVLFGILLIYNATQISNYNNAIARDNAAIEALSVQQRGLEASLNDLIGSNTPEALNMAEIAQSQIVNLSSQIAAVTNAEAAYTVPTNWFNALCNFIASIFGG